MLLLIILRLPCSNWDLLQYLEQNDIKKHKLQLTLFESVERALIV